MVLPLGNAVTAVNTMETGPPVCLFPTASAVVSEREVAMFICPPIAAAVAPAEAKSRVVATVIPLETPGWGGPVVNVLAPKVKVITEAVVSLPPVTTLMVPKPGVDPEAGVLVTSTVATVTPEHAVAQAIEQGLLMV